MEKTITNTEDPEIKKLLETLGDKNGMERQKARKKLAAKGKDMIDYLMELLDHPERVYRWESLKTMVEIGDPAAIPLFIRALEDDESDLRWIAAEGLIKLGNHSVKPLLKELIEKSDSVFVLAGVHHVFYDLKKKEKLPVGFPVDELLSAIKDPEWNKDIKLLAYDLLNKLES